MEQSYREVRARDIWIGLGPREIMLGSLDTTAADISGLLLLFPLGVGSPRCPIVRSKFLVR